MANDDTTTAMNNPRLRSSFLDIVEAKFSIQLVQTLKQLETTEPQAAPIVESYTNSVKKDQGECDSNFQAAINILTDRRQPEKVEALRKLLEDPSLGTPITTRLRNKVTYIVEQTVEVALIDELAKVILEKFRKLV